MYALPEARILDRLKSTGVVTRWPRPSRAASPTYVLAAAVTLAWPLASMVTGAEGSGVALAPLAGAVKVMSAAGDRRLGGSFGHRRHQRIGERTADRGGLGRCPTGR